MADTPELPAVSSPTDLTLRLRANLIADTRRGGLEGSLCRAGGVAAKAKSEEERPERTASEFADRVDASATGSASEPEPVAQRDRAGILALGLR